MKTISWLIGSDSACDIVVEGKGVAANHARLTQRSDGFHYLEDLESEKGTFVEGVRISEPCRVTPRDKITIGPKAVLQWPDAPPKARSERPEAEQPSRGNPLLYAAIGGALLLIGGAVGAFVAPQFMPADLSENGSVDPSAENVPDGPQRRSPEEPREGFKMGALQPNQPINTIRVTIDVDENGDALREMVELHMGLGFPLRLYPVGSDSREPSFAAFPQKSSLSPGQNSVDAGGRAWFEFQAAPEEHGLDELRTTPTLLRDLTIGDIHSIGFASRGESDWMLAGYKIEINGNLFASNDSVYDSAKAVQSNNEVEMLSRQAEIDALESQVQDQRDVVDSGLAGETDKAELATSEADLKLLKDRLNVNVGLVSGYYPWFQESSPEFKPAANDAKVKSVVVTLVAGSEEKSGTSNPLYLVAGPQKHLLSALPNALSDDAQQEQEFEIDSVSLEYDPIAKSQLEGFAIGMLGNDLPFAEIPDRAKFQRVSLEVDGETIFNSEQKEVDRETLSAIHLVPPVHRDAAGDLVENAESARQHYRWSPGMEVEATPNEPVGTKPSPPPEPLLVNQPRSNENNNSRGIIPPVRKPGRKPDVYVIMVPGRTPLPQPWGAGAGWQQAWQPWGSRAGGRLPWLNGLGPNAGTLPIRVIPPPPQRPPVISNVRITTPGLLRDGQPIGIAWNVAGNTSQIGSFRVTLKPVLPHLNAVFTQDVVSNVVTVPGSNARTASVRVALSNFAPSGTTSLSQQRKYLYLEPQVTALTSSAPPTTINGAATKGPIVPVSPLPPPTIPPSSQPIRLSNGPDQIHRRAMVVLNPWTTNSCPGYQFCGDGYGILSASAIYDPWLPYTPGDVGSGACAWRLTAPFTQPSAPLKIARFGSSFATEPNMGTSSWASPAAPGWTGNWIAIRYEAKSVNISEHMHLVAHMGFINGPALINNTATLGCQIIVQTAPVSPPSATSSTTELFRHTAVPLLSYSKLSGNQANPLQLIDIPIHLTGTSAQYSTAVTTAYANSGIPTPTPPTTTVRTATSYPVQNAHVSVTFFIKQSQRNLGTNGSEGIGIFGARLIPNR